VLHSKLTILFMFVAAAAGCTMNGRAAVECTKKRQTTNARDEADFIIAECLPTVDDFCNKSRALPCYMHHPL